MVDSRAKGARAELQARDILRKYTNLPWERVPASGALSVSHELKGDLYIPKHDNKYCVEVKHYAEDVISTKILTGKNPTLIKWWEQTLREANQVNRKPLLLFKHDRSKWFVASEHYPDEDGFVVFYGEYIIYIRLLEEWLKEGIIFTHE